MNKEQDKAFDAWFLQLKYRVSSTRLPDLRNGFMAGWQAGAAAEREACAQVAAQLHEGDHPSRENAGLEIATVIRARGPIENTPPN